MAPRQAQESMVETGELSPLTTSAGGESYGAVNAAAPARKDILRTAPSDLLSSMMSLKEMIEAHTGKIGYLGSFAIACNSLTGPAMLHLPATFRRSGLIPTLFALVFVCILAAMCSLHMANTISKVPGNSGFKLEVEYADVFRQFWGYKSFLFAQLLFFACVSCLNISSIVDTAQTVDTALGNYEGTWALQISWNADDKFFTWIRWQASLCSEEMDVSGTCLPFFNDDYSGTVILTAGYMIITAIFLPMALMDLQENAFAQIIGFLVLVLTTIHFAVNFIHRGLDFSNVTLWGEDWSGLFGVTLFNFALVIAIPAWLYEKEENVDVPTVIHGSSALCVVFYIVIGGLGVLSMPNVSENMLESMEAGVYGLGLQIGGSVFAFFIVGLGIPLFSVLTRYSLVGSKSFSTPVANVLAVYFPFGVGWMLYQGEGITNLLSWGGVIFTSLVAFILPLLVSLHTVEQFEYQGSIKVYPSYISALQSCKRSQVTALRVLIALAIFSIIAAMVGNIQGAS